MQQAFTHYNYPGIYQSGNFHYCGLEPDNNIANWYNEVEVWTCQLDGLAEYASTFKITSDVLTIIVRSLATDTEYVRQRLAEYGNDLLSLGVDGFRLDAAKST